MTMHLPLLAMLMAVQADPAPPEEVGRGPQPAAYPIAWEFEFKFQDPQRIEVQVAGRSEPQVYGYMLYTVTNTADNTQPFFPIFELVTQDLQVFHTDVGIHPSVFDAIRERHRATHPYLLNPRAAIGELRTGEDYARESVGIWRGVDLTANNFTIYVAGLSGETRIVRNPAWRPDAADTVKIKRPPSGFEYEQELNPKYFTLRKTLEIKYRVPGSPQARASTTPVRVSTRWIMR
jgi:hypothetical protein